MICVRYGDRDSHKYAIINQLEIWVVDRREGIWPMGTLALAEASVPGT